MLHPIIKKKTLVTANTIPKDMALFGQPWPLRYKNPLIIIISSIISCLFNEQPLFFFFSHSLFCGAHLRNRS